MRTRTALRLTAIGAMLLAVGAAGCNFEPSDDPCDDIPASGVILVNSSPDEEDGECGGDCTLREAVVLANTCPGAQTIQLGSAHYTLSIRGAGEDFAASGDLDLLEDVVIIGQGTVATFVESPNDRAFDVLTGVTVTIRDVAIVESRGDEGGALRNAGTLTLEDVDIQDSRASGSGGGILNTGDLTLTRTLLAGNDALEDGGGIYNQGRLSATDSTITDGVSHADGGGIYNAETASVDWHGGRIAGNQAVASGGGLHSQGPLASVILDDVVISRNWSEAGGGVALAATAATIDGTTFDTNYASEGGGLWIQGPVTVTDSTFTGNGSSDPNSQAIAVMPSDDSSLTMSGSTIESSAGTGLSTQGAPITLDSVAITNSSESGLSAFIDGARQTASLTNCTIEHNGSSGITSINYDLTLDGGSVTYSNPGIEMNGGSITASHLTVEYNMSPNEGGGFRLMNSLGGTIEDSTISRNESEGEGGGLYYWGLGSSVLSLRNVTLSTNTGIGGGGGLASATGASASLSLTHVTVTDNRATSGSGLLTTIDTQIVNSIVAGNAVGPNCAGAGLTSGGHNLEDTDTCGFSAAGDLSGVDPALGDLADNGGPTKTHALLEGSAAIDAADAGACLAADQRGVDRPQGAGCDIGAYEREAASIPAPALPDLRVTLDMNAFCRSGPGTVYPATSTFLQGAAFLAQGRTPDSSWIYGQPEDGEPPCWLSAAVFTPTFDLADLPHVAIPPTPIPVGDTEAPSVSISHAPGSPSPNNPVAFTAKAEDNEGVVKISIWVKKPGGDWEKVKTCENDDTCTYKGGPYAPGTVSYYAKAWDAAGNDAKSKTGEAEIQ